MRVSHRALCPLRWFICLKDFFGKAQSGALLSTESLTHTNITLPFVRIIMPYVRCKIVPHFHYIFLSLKCIHDIFNVTLVSPLVLVSLLGEHLLRTCLFLYKYLKV